MEGSKEEQVGGHTLNPKNAKGCDTKLGNPQDQAQTRPDEQYKCLLRGRPQGGTQQCAESSSVVSTVEASSLHHHSVVRKHIAQCGNRFTPKPKLYYLDFCEECFPLFEKYG
jgi:hypothetical protein